ncbi:MAG: TetR/AcrR family transcriptional regulator [Moraxellaceae bacterium]|nr:TetR/AcrR family transcriptional regulator [Moraxellaceae bacterium]
MRERIIAVARELFLRDGVAAVSMRNIAAEVDCSPMWLYRYFSNKQEILWQVWDVFIGELFSRLELVSGDSPRERLEQLSFCYFDYWIQYPERFCLVFLQEDLVPDATRLYVENTAFVLRAEIFTQIIKEAQMQGDLLGGNAIEITHGLFCLLQGLALNLITVTGYQWSDPTSLSRLTVKSYLNGLAKQK